MGHHGDEDVRGYNGSGDSQAQYQFSTQAVDSLPQQLVKFILSGGPRLDRVLCGRGQEDVERGSVAARDLATARSRAELFKVGLGAGSHGRKRNVDGPRDTALGICAIGGSEIGFYPDR